MDTHGIFSDPSKFRRFAFELPLHATGRKHLERETSFDVGRQAAFRPPGARDQVLHGLEEQNLLVADLVHFPAERIGGHASPGLPDKDLDEVPRLHPGGCVWWRLDRSHSDMRDELWTGNHVLA